MLPELDRIVECPLAMPRRVFGDFFEVPDWRWAAVLQWSTCLGTCLGPLLGAALGHPEQRSQLDAESTGGGVVAEATVSSNG